MFHYHRFFDPFTRLLALGVITCGAIICHSGLSFLSQSTQPFQENLHAIKETIRELDLTIVGLRNQSTAFNEYLVFVEQSLTATKLNLDQIDNQTAELFDLAGSSSVKLLNESADAATNASKLVRETANQAGGIPFDPLAEQRSALYAASKNFKTISSELNVLAVEISGQVAAFKKISSISLATAKSIVDTTEPQIKLLRTGPVERMPDMLKALSEQLGAHVKLIDASYGLLNKVSQPVIAVGVGFILLGLRGLLMRQAVPSTSIPVN
ncbi:MAG: hypothetical protein ACOYOF_16365 [Verrucomicrobiaceae bacterium]